MLIRQSSICVACALFLAAASEAMSAVPCENLTHAKQATYTPWNMLVVDDVKALSNGQQSEPFAIRIDKLAKEYYRKASHGDFAALNKLIGIGLFTALAKSAPPLDVTFKLVCASATTPQPSPTVLPALTCAVIALDGPRRDDPKNRLLARQMIDLAKETLERDSNGPAARRLFDDVAPLVASCSAE